MADGEKRDVNRHVFHVVEEEDHTQKKQDVIISRDHVLGAQIDERDDVDAEDFLDIAGVTGGHVVRDG